jgi:general secretion pathway protein E
MRQDPDIIMVGEIRDLATAQMAMQAALTGHLVFSTLHTNDAAATVTRLVDLGVPPFLISATVTGVLAQRLVRTLCPACKERDESAAATSRLRNALQPWTLTGTPRVYKPVGCLECRMTGYRGRAGLYELMTMTDDARGLVDRAASETSLRRQAVSDGMQPLRAAGAMKVAEGLTTLEEVLRATPAWELPKPTSVSRPSRHRRSGRTTDLSSMMGVH